MAEVPKKMDRKVVICLRFGRFHNSKDFFECRFGPFIPTSLKPSTFARGIYFLKASLIRLMQINGTHTSEPMDK